MKSSHLIQLITRNSNGRWSSIHTIQKKNFFSSIYLAPILYELLIWPCNRKLPVPQHFWGFNWIRIFFTYYSGLIPNLIRITLPILGGGVGKFRIIRSYRKPYRRDKNSRFGCLDSPGSVVEGRCTLRGTSVLDLPYNNKSESISLSSCGSVPLQIVTCTSGQRGITKFQVFVSFDWYWLQRKTEMILTENDKKTIDSSEALVALTPSGQLASGSSISYYYFVAACRSCTSKR